MTKDNVISVACLQPKSDSNKIKFEMKQKLGKPGKYAFQCYVCNDSFIGFDLDMMMEVTVAKEDKSREAAEYNNDDQELIEEAKRNAAIEKDGGNGASDDDHRDKEIEDDDKSQNANQLLEQAGLKKATGGKKGARDRKNKRR